MRRRRIEGAQYGNYAPLVEAMFTTSQLHGFVEYPQLQ